MSKDQDNRNDDAACGKIWEIYVKEAQQYDEGMVRSWKEDMDSMLVFSGLYSAILTAFVIESYQNLQPDLVEDSSLLLRRISEQLSSTSALPPIPDILSFTPTAAALACNVLWFISLALALTCSFLATLVQQWSRRFLHRTSTVRSPGTHARLLQFLYFGLKDLRMHAVVDLIPSLLHLSLFSFFGGLIAFLHDVNNILLWISITTLSLVLLVYVILTVLHILKLDSPYATPASSVLWRLLQIYRKFCASISNPVIPTFIRRSLHVGAPCLEGLESTDEEAQTEHPSHSFMAEGEDKDGLSFTALEWNIVDATVKASRIRHVERESQSIVWLLRSLNDNFELLPFVEALPDIIQYKEDGATFREANFHLLEALLASQDPQINIILRILDLMESSLSTWHTKAHRERCGIACARALYALGHVLQANPARFRPMTYNSPIFTTQIINRLGQGLCQSALDMSYGQSALVMCAFSSCRWLRARLALEPVNSSNFAWLTHQALAMKEIGWGLNTWGPSIRNSEGQTRFGPIRRHEAVDDAVSHLLFEYSYSAIHNYPQHFSHLSELIIRDIAKHPVRRFNGGRILEMLGDAMQRGVFKESDTNKVDAILYVPIYVSVDGDTLDDLHKFLPACISSYHRAFGWGDLSILWRPAILSRVLKSLWLTEDDPRPFEEDYVISLKHLSAYHFSGEDYPFWADIFRDIHRVPRDKSFQELSLTYLIALKMSTSFQPISVWIQAERESLLEQMVENASIQKFYPGINPKYPITWIVLLDCLGGQLPISHTSDFLKLFHAGQLCVADPLAVSNDGPFLTLLTRYSKEYFSKFAHCLKQDFQPLLEVNAMIWVVWKHLARVLSIETLEICQAWDNAISLLEMIDGALTSEMREVSKAILNQPHSTKNPSSSILLPKNRGWDFRRCLDLPANIELTKDHLARHKHVFTRLPEADAEEARCLAIDDDTYSNRHPIHRDRLAAHYFVQLPPSNKNEEAALQPPHNDFTYLHIQPAKKGL